MSRYRTHGTFSPAHQSEEGIVVEIADALDTRTGTVYTHSAYRVTVDGKPVRGKGGTVPFYGESAWSAADRLYFDLVLKARFA